MIPTAMVSCDVKELQASPPLMDLLQNLKAQPSGHPDTLTEADIAGRLEEWVKSSTTLLPAIPTVWLDGRPLAGATVTFEPEPFLGPSYRSHKGETNGAGIARLDPDLQDFPGVHVGLYRIRISKTADGKEIVPGASTRKRNSAWNSPSAPATARGTQRSG